MQAKAGVAGSDILLGNDAAAQAGIDALIRYFAEDPELAGLLWRLGDNMRRVFKKYDWSRQLYQHIIETDPQGPLAMQAKAGVAGSDILLGNDAAAQAGIDGLIADFADHPKLPREICALAEDCLLLKRYEDARQLWQRVVDTWPESNYVMKSRIGIMRADIKLGDHEAADAGIETILAKYSDHKDLLPAFCQLGDDYLEAGKHDKAIECYQYVIADRPDGSLAISAWAGIGKVHIELGDDEAVTAVIDNLIADYNDHPRLPWAVFVLGEEYYNLASGYQNQRRGEQARESFTKAIAVWERIIGELPVDIPHTPHAYYFSAGCYRRLGEYEKAVEYYDKVVTDWPNYEYAWLALLRTARTYEHLRRSGAMPEGEADGKIRGVYERILAEYPESSAANDAYRWIGNVRR